MNDKLSTQISTFKAAPGILANGKLTITEDVADLGGLNIAFDALNEYLKNKGVTGEELEKAQKKLAKLEPKEKAPAKKACAKKAKKEE